MKVGFIGLGNVGAKLAGTLLRNDYDLTVKDLDAERMAPFLEQGAASAASPCEMIRDLLTHTSGLGYGPGYDSSSALGKAYGDLNLTHAPSLAEAVRKLTTVPLYFQPGEGWRYSYAHDVLGRLVEVVRGVPFDEFLRKRLFEPLGMRSTGVYRHDSTGHLVPLESDVDSRNLLLAAVESLAP